jgi:hypothetical protein
MQLPARSWLRGSSCELPRVTIEMRPIDSATQHSSNEYPYSSAPGSSSPSITARACTRQVAPIETEESSVSRRSKRFGGSPYVRGEFSSRDTKTKETTAQRIARDQPLTPLSPPLLAPRMFPLFLRCVTRQGPPDRFHSEHREALEDFAIRGAFPRQATHDSACPLQVTDRESSSASRWCRSRFRLSASFHPAAFPRSVLRTLRGFLAKETGTCGSTCDLAKIVIRGLGPRSRVPPNDVEEPLS